MTQFTLLYSSSMGSLSTRSWWSMRLLSLLPLLIATAAAAGAKTMEDDSTTISRSGLSWTDLSVQTQHGKFLLHPTSGFVPNGQICGILGPSGSGKTTFLSSLAGTIHATSKRESGSGSGGSGSGGSGSGLEISGAVLYHNAETNATYPLDVHGGQVAWLQQTDAFFNMLTVRETLEMAAFLELPHFSRRQRDRRVQSNMDSLGLTKLQHRRIGESSRNNGLSGGEQRRLSLALELIARPKLFIGDEPTSGLDSTLSEKVVKLIKKLVQQRQIPSFLSLHQPRSSIWRMLDSVILMAPGGRICYSGSTHDALSYFSRLGYNCPEETNPAEFLLDLVSIDSEDPYVAATDDERIAQLASAFLGHQKEQQQRQQLAPAESDSEPRKKPSMVSLFTDKSNKMMMEMSSTTTTSTRGTSFGKRRRRKKFRLVPRFGYLLHRAWRQNVRNHRVNILRLVASIGNALLFSKIFGSIQKGFVSAKSVADRTALLSFGVINMSMMALMKTIDLFAREKPVVMREQQRRQYTSLEYLLSKAVAELPLDTLFSAVFTTVLKVSTGIRISWTELTGAFSLMTVAGASLGFAVGALSPTAEIAMSAGVPLMVILMTVGVINPSGVRANQTPSLVVDSLKRLSPIASAIQAVVLGEFRGMIFQRPKRGLAQDLPKMGALALVKNGEQVLEELGLGQATYRGAMKHLAVLSAMNLFISWVGLQLHSSSSSSATDMTPAYWLQFQSDNHDETTDEDEE